MLILNEDLWEKDRIIKVWCSNNWDDKDNFIMTECVLKRVKDLLIEAEKTNREGVLICDCNKGQFPPMIQALQIVAFMVSIKKQIEGGLTYTLVYVKSDDHKKWVDSIFIIYRPARPVRIVSTKDELKKNLLESDRTFS